MGLAACPAEACVLVFVLVFGSVGSCLCRWEPLLCRSCVSTLSRVAGVFCLRPDLILGVRAVHRGPGCMLVRACGVIVGLCIRLVLAMLCMNAVCMDIYLCAESELMSPV